MKALGVVRKLDPLGRIVLSADLRRNLHIEIGTIYLISNDYGKTWL